MEAFTESLSDMKVHDFELIEYTADDWKTIFCVEHRRALKHVVFQLLQPIKRHDASTDFIHCWAAAR
jgi:hypothetical protein